MIKKNIAVFAKNPGAKTGSKIVGKKNQSGYYVNVICGYISNVMT